MALLCNVRFSHNAALQCTRRSARHMLHMICMVLQLQLIVPQDTLAGSAAQVAVPADSRQC